MEVEKLGEEIIDGKTLNIDDMSVDSCMEQLKKISSKKEEIVKQINKLITQI